MLVVFAGIVGAFQLAVDAVSNNKARAGAIALANERLEFIRSLTYEAVGTYGGLPGGALAQSETVSLNGVSYARRTFISWEDDPGDGLSGADQNGVITDYKAAKISVSWTTRRGTRTLTLVSRISPPGVETAVPGGTIVVAVTNATSEPVPNAAVRIENGNLFPPIDLTTYTDATGVASVLGAPPSGGYAVSVSKSGYSSAQTYSASATNTNPIPAHLGVALNQTTPISFQIDSLASHTIETYTIIEEESWTDSFADESYIASSSQVVVDAGEVQLAFEDVYASPGNLFSSAISDPYLSRWKEFSWNDTQPSGTAIRYSVYDSSYALLPDEVLPGNSDGFLVSPISLTSIATSTYGLLRFGAQLSTADETVTPRLHSWSLVYDVGPEPVGNVPFVLRGAKTVGTAADGALIYKYHATLATNVLGTLTLPQIEWDTYTLSMATSSVYDIASSCAPQPVAIAPSANVTTRLFLAPRSNHSLLVDVRAPNGSVVSGASVRLQQGAYDELLTTDLCGQALFPDLSAGSVGTGNPYTITVTAGGYTPYSASDVTVSGTSRQSVILN